MDYMGELVKIAVQQGGFAVLALIMFIAYRKDVKGTADVLIAVVVANTKALTELTDMVRAMHRRLDRESDR